MPTILAFASVVPLLATSCQNKGAKPVNTNVTIDDWWTLDYVYKTNSSQRLTAQYLFQLEGFEPGETIDFSIINQKDMNGEEGNFVSFTNDQPTHFDITDQTEISLYLNLAQNELYESFNEFSFNMKILITHTDGSTTELISKKLYLEIAKPTLPEHFNSTPSNNDSNECIITGFDTSHQADIEKCTLLAIPDEIGEQKVVGIADNAFYDNTNEQTLIPSSINYLLLDSSWGTNGSLKTIGKNAFKDASFDGELYIPGCVETIDENAFEDTWFGGIHFGYPLDTDIKLSEIKASAFSGATFHSSLVLPNKLTKIGERGFFKAKFLGNIEFPKSLKTIEKDAFRQIDTTASTQRAPGKLIIPKDSELEKFGYYSFGYSNIQGELYIPDHLHFYGSSSGWEDVPGCCDNMTFVKCKYISTLSLPKNFSVRGNQTFQYLSGLSCLDLTRIESINDVQRWRGIDHNTYPAIFHSKSEFTSDKITVVLKNACSITKEQWEDILSDNNFPIDKVKFEYVN